MEDNPIHVLEYHRKTKKKEIISFAANTVIKHLSCDDLIDLINGDSNTQQSVASRVVHEINNQVNQLKHTVLNCNDVIDENNINIENKTDLDEQDIDDISIQNDIIERMQKMKKMISTCMIEDKDKCDTSNINKYVLENRDIGGNILNMLDDNSVGKYLLLNKKCYQNSKNTSNFYKNINNNEWLWQYSNRGVHATRHMIIGGKITLDFSRFTSHISTQTTFMIQTLKKMRTMGLFRNCVSIVISSVSTEISKWLHCLIHSLHKIKEMEINDCEIFPMIKIINNIKTREIDRLSMKNIQIKRGCDSDDSNYTPNDDWFTNNFVSDMSDNSDMNNKISECQLFVTNILKAKELEVFGWQNKYDYWIQALDDIRKLFVPQTMSSAEKVLPNCREMMKQCPIQCITYIVTNPETDRIPYLWFRFMLRFKIKQIKKLRLDFGNKSNFEAAMKAMINHKYFKMELLNELQFKWNENEWHLLDKLIKKKNTATNLKKLKIWIPSHQLSKSENTLIKSIKNKFPNCVQTDTMY